MTTYLMKDGNVKKSKFKYKPRKKLKQAKNYFASGDKPLEFITSGCQVLDCVLGGGYPLGRMSNIIGDKSTAKTHLACEAITNFTLDYPDGAACYIDTEAAFEKDYAAAMGMPIDNVEFDDEDNPIITIENWYKHFSNFLKTQLKNNTPGIYVIDSLDALSSDEEMERPIDKSSYSMTKQKKLGEMFRRKIKTIEKSRVNLMIISQVRENINVSFGEKYRRSGGKSMDFFASQCLWLAHIGKIPKINKKVKRTVGINIKAICKKNKISLPFRECEFEFIFGYGVDDLHANVNWLKSVNKLSEFDLSENDLKTYFKEVEDMNDKKYKKERKQAANIVKRVWAEVEIEFLPTRTKY